MKYTRLLLILLSISLLSMGDSMAANKKNNTPQAFHLRYLHWNIGHYANGNDYKSAITADDYEAKKAEYRRIFAKYHADVVGICEWSSIFYGEEKAVDALLPQYAHHYIAPKERYYIGVALHSVFPLSEMHEVELKRGYTAYEGVFYLGGKKVILCECHLPWQSFELNDSSITILLDRYKNEERVLIAGDFNFREKDRVASTKRFTDSGFEAANCGYFGNLLTCYNVSSCTPYLDNIFVKGGKILNTEVEQITPDGYSATHPNAATDEKERLEWEAANLSDHFPLISDIVFEW
ncbi:MAG: endonuclease/exonuclease/phosphatase family protein [Paludibacteraceae bacterium]|nr:endonuclease/exonuclease/phosphatase family protein [Paludibacteraceae bacterium]